MPDADCCNFHREVRDTTPVGIYSPFGDSPYGCADMAGNVFEYTTSIQAKYPYNAEDGREGQNIIGWRVVRGGSFFLGHTYVRTVARFWDPQNDRQSYIGFRSHWNLSLVK